jgi:cell division transport system ATP-binding protein
MKAVHKVYPPRIAALSDVNLEVERGEFVFLIGSSGAGKSTLTRLLYREEQASAGEVRVNGLDLMTMPSRRVPFFRRHVGVVFQDYKLLPHKTVAENIAFPLMVAEYGRREIRRRVGQILEVVGLEHRSDALPAELSGGEQQRAGLARAIINNPVLLLADEPTGNLDPENSLAITELLVEINRRGTTCVVATHSAQMVDRLRRRVVEIEGGRVVRDQARAGYVDRNALIPEETERRLALAAGVAARRLSPPSPWSVRSGRRA